MGTHGRSQNRGTSRRKAWDSESTVCLGTAFPKRNSSSQTLVLWSASNNEILKNSWQENIKNKTKQKNNALGSNPDQMTPYLRYPSADIFKSLPYTPGDSPTVLSTSATCGHSAPECVSPNPDML